jgi:hypothetical protein
VSDEPLRSVTIRSGELQFDVDSLAEQDFLEISRPSSNMSGAIFSSTSFSMVRPLAFNHSVRA